jgi:hypothetical protein
MSDYEDDSDSSYSVNQELLALRLQLSLMEGELKNVKDENRALKENLQVLCMNESDNTAAAKKKKKLSPATLARWQHYHLHKDAIRAEKGLTEWRDVKRESDARFAAAATQTS